MLPRLEAVALEYLEGPVQGIDAMARVAATTHLPMATSMCVIMGAIARHGEWARIDGYGDAPLDATAELGERVPTTVVAAVSDALIAVHHATEAP